MAIPRVFEDGCALAESSLSSPGGEGKPRQVQRLWRGIQKSRTRRYARAVKTILKVETKVSTIAVSDRKDSVPLLDLGAQHRQIRDEVLAEIARVIDSQKFILGEDVKQLERRSRPIAARSMRSAAPPDPTRCFWRCWRSIFVRATRYSPRRIRSSPPSAPSPAWERFPVFGTSKSETFNMDVRQLAQPCSPIIPRFAP